MSEDEDREDRDEVDNSPPASEKQVKFIQVLKDKVGLKDDEFEELLDEVAGETDLSQLTIRMASSVIDQLQIEGKERGVDLDSQPKASGKQIGFIKSLKRRAQLTQAEFDELLQEVAGVEDVEDIGKRDASALIDELLQRADAAKGGGGKKKTAKKKTAAKKAAPAPEPPADDGDYDEDDVPF